MANSSDRTVLADVYARGLLDLAANEQHADAIEHDLSVLAEVARRDARFDAFVASPVIASEAKSRSVAHMFDGRLNELTVRFLRVLADHDRLGLLDLMPAAFERARDARRRRVRVQATTAVPLDEDLRRRLIGQLADQLSAEVMLEERTDPSIVGGLVLRIDDWLMDGSARGRLEQMRGKLIERGRHEIQSGRDFLAH